MKKINIDRALILVLALGLLVTGTVDLLQGMKINKLEKQIKSIGVPIEQKDDFWVEEIPNELKEVNLTLEELR